MHLALSCSSENGVAAGDEPQYFAKHFLLFNLFILLDLNYNRIYWTCCSNKNFSRKCTLQKVIHSYGEMTLSARYRTLTFIMIFVMLLNNVLCLKLLLPWYFNGFMSVTDLGLMASFTSRLACAAELSDASLLVRLAILTVWVAWKSPQGFS